MTTYALRDVMRQVEADTRTKTRSLQTNGICERFNRTVLNEFYRVAFRRKLYTTLDELQADLDAWLREYNGAAAAPGPLMLREDADADLQGKPRVGEGEDAGRVTIRH
jgi:hypothetical protein